MFSLDQHGANHERFQQEAERVKPLLNAALSLGDLK
jgi:hypothetical protein